MSDYKYLYYKYKNKYKALLQKGGLNQDPNRKDITYTHDLTPEQNNLLNLLIENRKALTNGINKMVEKDKHIKYAELIKKAQYKIEKINNEINKINKINKINEINEINEITNEKQKGGMESDDDGGGGGAGVDDVQDLESKKTTLINNILELIGYLMENNRYKTEGLFRYSPSLVEQTEFNNLINTVQFTPGIIENYISEKNSSTKNIDGINHIYLISSGIKYILTELIKLKLFVLDDFELKPKNPSDILLENVYNQFYLLVKSIIDYTEYIKKRKKVEDTKELKEGEERLEIEVNTLDITGFVNMIYMICTNGADGEEGQKFLTMQVNKTDSGFKEKMKEKLRILFSKINANIEAELTNTTNIEETDISKQIIHDEIEINKLIKQITELKIRNRTIKLKMSDTKFIKYEALLKCALHNNETLCKQNNCTWKDNKCNPTRSWTETLSLGFITDIDKSILEEFKNLQNELNHNEIIIGKKEQKKKNCKDSILTLKEKLRIRDQEETSK